MDTEDYIAPGGDGDVFTGKMDTVRVNHSFTDSDFHALPEPANGRSKPFSSSSMFRSDSNISIPELPVHYGGNRDRSVTTLIFEIA